MLKVPLNGESSDSDWTETSSELISKRSLYNPGPFPGAPGVYPGGGGSSFAPPPWSYPYPYPASHYQSPYSIYSTLPPHLSHTYALVSKCIFTPSWHDFYQFITDS